MVKSSVNVEQTVSLCTKDGVVKDFKLKCHIVRNNDHM